LTLKRRQLTTENFFFCRGVNATNTDVLTKVETDCRSHWQLQMRESLGRAWST